MVRSMPSSVSTRWGSGRHRARGSRNSADGSGPGTHCYRIATAQRRSHLEYVAGGGREITDLLEAAGFSHSRTEMLDLDPPLVCVLAVNAPLAAAHVS
jgi:hypothetical protein